MCEADWDLHTNKVPLAGGVHAVQTDAIKIQLCRSTWGEMKQLQFLQRKPSQKHTVLTRVWQDSDSGHFQSDLCAAVPCRCQMASLRSHHWKQERSLLTDCVCEWESLPDGEFYLPRGKTSTLLLISWSWSTSLLRATAWLKERAEEKQEIDMNNTSSNVWKVWGLQWSLQSP